MKRKRKLGPVFVFLGIVILSVVLFFGGEYSIFRLFKLKGERAAEQKEVAELKEKIAKQKETNELLMSGDSLEMERKARERGMIKEGETIYIYEIEKEN
ncbi:MAG: septum formation initiator family protein [Candidatus Delongbacteria bacterium]|nr:septum formation initiator family protein [Candidatus Delongbacteria bacterium]